MPSSPSRAANQAGNPVKVGDGPIDIPGGRSRSRPTGGPPTSRQHRRHHIPHQHGPQPGGQTDRHRPQPYSGPDSIAITPDGQDLLRGHLSIDTVTPVSTASGTWAWPIHVGAGPVWIAITPDGRTAYVANESQPGTITRIKHGHQYGRPCRSTSRASRSIIAITPDGKTAYVLSRSAGAYPPGAC